MCRDPGTTKSLYEESSITRLGLSATLMSKGPQKQEIHHLIDLSRMIRRSSLVRTEHDLVRLRYPHLKIGTVQGDLNPRPVHIFLQSLTVQQPLTGANVDNLDSRTSPSHLLSKESEIQLTCGLVNQCIIFPLQLLLVQSGSRSLTHLHPFLPTNEAHLAQEGRCWMQRSVFMIR